VDGGVNRSWSNKYNHGERDTAGAAGARAAVRKRRRSFKYQDEELSADPVT